MANPLAGRWMKVARDGCGETYPGSIEFRERGIYAAQPAVAGGFSTWDSGSYELVDARTVRISTANDAVIPYAFTLEGDRLSFVDPDGCRFEYRRA